MNEISNIIYGMWRLEGLDDKKVYDNLIGLKKLGINTIDTADIYKINNYGDSERLIGKALSYDKSLKNYFNVVTKCGICTASEKSSVKFYDNTKEYIINTVKNSLENLGVDKIYLLLLHRPAPFMDFEEVYQAFKYLKEEGMVQNFGVSNYTPIQFDSLNKYLLNRGINLITNQIEMNPLTTEHIDNENIYYLKGEEITPMIWSPMAGGQVFDNNNVNDVLVALANKYNVDTMNIVIAYLNSMGLEVKIVLGTHKLERYESAITSLDLRLESHEMYMILESYTKKSVK